MAQRVINGEQYEALLIRGDLNGGPVPVAFASGVTISGVTLGAEVEVTNDSGNPLPISAASLPLPTGAATEAKQDTLIGHVDGVEGLLSTIDADTSSIDGKLPALSSGRIPVEIGAITLGDVEIKNDSGNPLPVVQGLSVPEHDYIDLAYSGSTLTGVTYKTGGAGGTTVATLTLAYDGSDNLTSITKS